MLSDKDIQKAIANEDIVIEDFSSDSLTPVGYDIRVGEFAFIWSKKERILIKEQPEQKLRVAPGDSVLIATRERLKVSPRIGGIVLSRFGQILNGFTHVSTTLDPGWPGPGHTPGYLLVAIHNQRDIPLELRYEDALCTVCFHEVDSEATHQTHPNATLAQNPWTWLGDIETKARSLQKKPFYHLRRFWFALFALLIAATSIIFFRPTDFQDWIQLAGVVALFIIAALQQRG